MQTKPSLATGQSTAAAPTHALFPRAILSDRRFQRRPRAILVLLTFCTFANRETGHAFPSLRTVSELLGIELRAVRRTVSLLRDAGWLIEVGTETDNGVNKYMVSHHTPGSARPGGEGPHDPPIGGGGNIIYLYDDHKNQLQNPPPPPLSVLEDPSKSQESFKKADPVTENLDLIFPPELTPEQQIGIRSILRGLDPVKCQAILDELAPVLESGRIQRPVKYLEKLAEKARSGTFIPERGIAVAKKRKDALANVERLRKMEEKTQSSGPQVSLDESIATISQRVTDPQMAAILEKMGKGMLERRMLEENHEVKNK